MKLYHSLRACLKPRLTYISWQTFPPSKYPSSSVVSRPPSRLQEVMADSRSVSGEKKFRWMRLAVKETLEHLSNIKPIVKDVSGFWLWVLVSHGPIWGYQLMPSKDVHKHQC